MELYDNPQNHQPPSHYEIVVFNENMNIITQYVKYTAFAYMDQLEGWCTKNKASVLIDFIFMMNPHTIVEIGVWGGKSLIPMACALKVSGQGKIYGIDPWENSASTEGMDGINYDWWSKVDHEMILRGLQIKIADFQLTEQIELIRTTSEEADPISNIDILHIDGNHSAKACNLDIQKWVPLVRKGGLIILDDVNWVNETTNEYAVKWLDSNCIRFSLFRESNEWGIWVKP